MIYRMMLRKLLLILLTCTCTLAHARKCEVIWTEGKTGPSGKTAIHTLELRGLPGGTEWTLWFCQFRTPVTMEEGAPATIEHLGGTLYRVHPVRAAKKGRMTLRYEARTLVNRCRAPEGFYLQKKGKKPVPVKVTYIWQDAEPVPTIDWSPVELSPFDMIPRLKKVTPKEGTTPAGVSVRTEKVSGQVPGWYRITLDGGIRVEAADDDGAFYANVTLENLRRTARGGDLPNGVLEDAPDLPYRGIMLDVSRNFTRKEDVLKLLNILAHYKINYFHLHFGDDEGWRVEIDALPELTSYGAFRGIPVLQKDGSILEKDALMPTYCVTPDRNDTATSGNGYYSHADFVEILRYAWARRIRVIPEFDTPGHSRAAVKSMEVRAARTGDTSCLLSEAADTSRYMSVQDYNDNAINVALPSTYRFIETVFDALIALYAEAGVPLEAIHIGGDEVPDGAWKGSPACQALLKQEGRTDTGWLKDYFINRVMNIAEQKGVRIAGWQEVGQHLEKETFARLKKNLAFTNLWAVSRGRDVLAYTYANEGIPVILSNSSNFYFDLAYNPSKTERGHSWAGFTDERRSFSFLPYQMYRSVRWDDKGRMRKLTGDGAGKPALTQEGRTHILGVQGQLWSETLRCFDHVTYYLFPKALGMAERGWNATPLWQDALLADDPAFTADFNHFFSIITSREYPYYDSLGISYHRN